MNLHLSNEKIENKFQKWVEIEIQNGKTSLFEAVCKNENFCLREMPCLKF
jgi:hypothetical protein